MEKLSYVRHDACIQQQRQNSKPLRHQDSSLSTTGAETFHLLQSCLKFLAGDTLNFNTPRAAHWGSRRRSTRIGVFLKRLFLSSVRSSGGASAPPAQTVRASLKKLPAQQPLGHCTHLTHPSTESKCFLFVFRRAAEGPRFGTLWASERCLLYAPPGL